MLLDILIKLLNKKKKEAYASFLVSIFYSSLLTYANDYCNTEISATAKKLLRMLFNSVKRLVFTA